MGRKTSDEAYVLDVADQILGLEGQRQHRFEFLRGDAGHRLPVDVYYPSLQLVLEYQEKQHAQAVTFFDQRERGQRRVPRPSASHLRRAP